jgi:hypothetical protein
MLLRPTQPHQSIQTVSQTQISSPKRVQRGARVPTSCWHPCSSIILIIRFITASSSSHLSNISWQAIQRNEVNKQPVTRTFANDPVDHCKHQHMLYQALAITSTWWGATQAQESSPTKHRHEYSKQPSRNWWSHDH